MKRYPSKAFTIIELLVVVSIIALLIGILLPAIGKARDQAKLTQSKGNMRNLATAHATYSAEWNDRQITFVDDNLARYGNGTNTSTYDSFHLQTGDYHPPMILGYRYNQENDSNGMWGYYMSHPGNIGLCEPIVFPGTSQYSHVEGFGSFRMANCKQFNSYVAGRYYDPIWFAPKDKAVITAVEECFDDPGEFCTASGSSDTYWTSYCLSPAAMFNPDVMRNPTEGNGDDTGWQSPWELDAGFRSPSMGQASFPDLKTHMLEHHWLQGAHSDCNSNFEGGTYNGCEPYYFNAGWESVPVALFYDGHIEGIGVREAMKASARNNSQAGYHLWHTETSFGGTLPEDAIGSGDYLEGGYFMDASWDPPSNRQRACTSFHVLTTDGILGRDKLGD